MKSYTDLEQSKVLSQILSPESADMTCIGTEFVPYPYCESKFKGEDNVYPAWSLTALIELLPSELSLPRYYFLEISKMGDCSTPYEVRYYRFRKPLDGADFGRITHISYSSQNLVDACVAMILNLHELNLL